MTWPNHFKHRQADEHRRAALRLIGMAKGARRLGESLRCERCWTTDPAAFKTPRSHFCKECLRAIDRERHARNYRDEPEKFKDRSATYRRSHPGRVAESERRYKESHRAEVNERFRAWYAKNKDHVSANYNPRKRENTRRLRAESADFRARERAWSAANAGRRREYVRRWKAKNPAVALQHVKRRRARKHSVESTLTLREWVAILESFNHACAYCLRTGVKLTQEHVAPISKGGPHTAENVVPACTVCNSRKGNRSILTMLRYQT